MVGVLFSYRFKTSLFFVSLRAERRSNQSITVRKESRCLFGPVQPPTAVWTGSGANT